METIQVYCRIRPIFDPQEPLFPYTVKQDFDSSFLEIKKPTLQQTVNNSLDSYLFKFRAILDQNAVQDEVFSICAKPSVQSALDGYNSTIFVYGQTGSGKTWTMTGGPAHYKDRGIIPRTISYMFEQIESRSQQEQTQYTIRVNYLEIYSSGGYDLLVHRRENFDYKHTSKIGLFEDDQGNFHVSNLTYHIAKTEDDALNLLFIGDSNKIISETKMNENSSRSHCIFTFTIESRNMNQNSVVKVSKLHLVDLAGSERVYKTNSEGRILNEAKFINASLHYLEQVIVSLNKNAQHVPYRNSLLTSLLRDSIGGNCRTVMIATINPAVAQLSESISSCRFSQQVASIKVTPKLNEKVDPEVLIRQLKSENRKLKEQLAFYKSNQEEGQEISDQDKYLVKSKVEEFISNVEGSINTLELQGNFNRINEAFLIMRQMIQQQPSSSSSFASRKSIEQPISQQQQQSSTVLNPAVEEQILNLTKAIEMRDYEIGVLVNMIEKYKNTQKLEIAIQTDGLYVAPEVKSIRSIQREEDDDEKRDSLFHRVPANPTFSLEKLQQEAKQKVVQQYEAKNEVQQPFKPFQNENLNQIVNVLDMQDRIVAFEKFRKSYKKTQLIESSKESLKQKYIEIKEVAKEVTDKRDVVAKLKETLLQIRAQKSAQGLVNNSIDATQETEEEQQILNELIEAKQNYLDGCEKIKSLKKEIEYLDKGIRLSEAQRNKDFESWYSKTNLEQANTNPLPSASSSSDQGSRPSITSLLMQQRQLQEEESETPRSATSSFNSSQKSSNNSLRSSITTNTATTSTSSTVSSQPPSLFKSSTGSSTSSIPTVASSSSLNVNTNPSSNALLDKLNQYMIMQQKLQNKKT